MEQLAKGGSTQVGRSASDQPTACEHAPQQVSVAVVAPDLLVRAGLRALLEPAASIIVTSERETLAPTRADSEVRVVVAACEAAPEEVEQLVREQPDCRLLIVCDQPGSAAADLLRAGAMGVVLSQSVTAELCPAIEHLARGEPFIGADLFGSLVENLRKTDATHSAGQLAAQDAADFLLETKLHKPPPPTHLLARPKVNELLNTGRNRPLTLVSAPAGYGKSIAVSSWLEDCDWHSAWLSLDAADSDVRRFLRYCAAAIKRMHPHALETTCDLIDAPDMASIEAVAQVLNNDLQNIIEPLVLVLDDYHLIHTSSAVHTLLQTLLDRPPLCLHLVIVTRSDPPLSLARLRARDQINDVRMRDLMFSEADSARLVEQMTGTKLDRAVRQLLQQKLEGWVSGLCLASLAMRGATDVGAVLANLENGDTAVTEYLVQEVLSQLGGYEQQWVLNTTVLERFCAELCDVVRPDGTSADHARVPSAGAFLDRLLSQNLFVIALDTRQHWFRYHHEFRQQLRHELERSQSAKELAGLHHRAACWFAAQGHVSEAIDGFFAANAPAAAVRLLENVCFDEINRDRHGNVDEWLAKLPPELIAGSLKLLMAAACVELDFRFDLERAWWLLAQTERFIEAGEAADVSWVGAQASFMRGVMHYWQGESTASLENLSRSLSDMPATNGYFEGERHLMLAMALAMEGQTDAALEQLQDTERQRSAASQACFRVRLVGAQAFLELLRGNLSRVALLGGRIKEITVQEPNRYRFTREFGHYLQGYACLQKGDLEQAADLLSAVAARRYATHHAMSADALAALALTLALKGEAQEAARVVSLLLEFGIELDDIHVKGVGQSCAARLALLGEGTAAAAQWLSSPLAELEPAGLFFWSEVPILTRARVLIADGGEDALHEAKMMLVNTRKHADRWRYVNQVLEADVLLALAELKLDRHDSALVTLAGAMPTATRGGWLRPFLEAGEPMLELVSRLPAELEQQRLVARLQTAYGELKASRLSLPPQADLVEPLTPRERSIVALLARRLQNKEIARELQVSPETVKTHLRHIYDKLGVHSRREAVAKAAEVLPELTSRSS